MYAVPELTVPAADIARWGSPASLAMGLAAHPERWWRLLDYRTDTRWYRLLERTEQHEVWLLSWLPGQSTDLHDHGPASGAFAIAAGTLTERVVAAKPGRPPVEVTRALSTGRCRAFGPHYIHDLVNDDASYEQGDFASAAASGVPSNRGARTLDLDPDYVAGPNGSQENN